MRDGGAKRSFFGSLGIDMDKLMVLCDIGKHINAGLIDQKPIRGAGVLANQRLHIVPGDILHPLIVSKNCRPSGHIDPTRQWNDRASHI